MKFSERLLICAVAGLVGALFGLLRGLFEVFISLEPYSVVGVQMLIWASVFCAFGLTVTFDKNFDKRVSDQPLIRVLLFGSVISVIFLFRFEPTFKFGSLGFLLGGVLGYFGGSWARKT
jgi:hypothetical protein